MANGICPYILQDIVTVTKENTPEFKVQPNGYTRMLLNNGTAVIKNDSFNGHTKTVQVKKSQRFTIEQTDTSFSCDNQLVPSYNEDTVTVASKRQIAIHVDDETIAQYCDEHSAMSNLATRNGSRPIMQEFLRRIFNAANALMRGVNQDLLTLQVSTFGVNRVTGLSTSTSLNLPKDTGVQPLDQGMNKLLTDYKRNEGFGRPQVVGAGFMLSYAMQQFGKAGFDESGVDSRIPFGAIDYYYDEDVESKWGSNQIGVFQPNAVQLVEYLRYQGFKAGSKPGASEFSVISMPVFMGKEDVAVLDFDLQVKYYDCAETITDAYTGGSLDIEKGWSIILSKQFGLYTLGSTEYRAEDPLTGNRGSLRYTLTNDCDSCS